MKLFLKTLLLFLLPLVLLFGTTTAYYYFAIHPCLTGDLGRLGAIPFGVAYSDSMSMRRLPFNRVTETAPGNTCNAQIVTIGDSFSQQREYGYQNFLAHATDCTVQNIEPMRDPVQAAVDLLNNGFFDDAKPQTVIVEIVGRSLPGALTSLQFDSKRPLGELIALRPTQQQERLTTSSLMHYTYNWLMLRMRENPVCEVPTDRQLFTLRPEKLYFYRDDLGTLSCSDAEAQTMQRSLVQLHALFARHGIRFMLLVAVDKYDLYQQFIVDNPHPAKTIFDQMARACDTTLYVDTKQLFTPLLMDGTRDLYHANDTHWSQTGASAVAAELVRRGADCAPPNGKK